MTASNLDIPREQIVRNTPNGARNAAPGERGPHGPRWFLTINNPSIDTIAKLEALQPNDKISFLAYCLEHRGPMPECLQSVRLAAPSFAPATWTKHYHVYIEFTSDQRRSCFKKLLAF